MANPRIFLFCLLGLLGLSGCGDFPTPFRGNPGATAARLARPPAPLLVVVPPDAAAPAFADALAVALQAQDVPAEVKKPRASEWQLLSRLEPRGSEVVPIYTVKDPTGADQGSTQGSPVPLTAWFTSSPAVLKQVASDSAPKIAALLNSIRITRDRADPNSLMNRPARVMVADVTGAPGDGDQSLTRQVRTRLAAYGPLVQSTRDGADFVVRGDVVVTPIGNKKERVEIQWTVTGANGDERGKVVQLNEIPAGTLDHYWGDVAVAVATEAAGGLNDVILKQSGRDRAIQPAAAKPDAAAAGAVSATADDALPTPPIPPARQPARTRKPGPISGAIR